MQPNLRKNFNAVADGEDVDVECNDPSEQANSKQDY